MLGKNKTRNWVKGLAVLGLIVAMASTGVFTAHAVLDEQLPNVSDFSAGGVSGAVDLHLKSTDAAEVYTNTIGAYYPSNDNRTAGKKIKITAGRGGRNCHIGASLTGSLSISVSYGPGQTTTVAKIPLQKICGDTRPRANDDTRFYDKTFDFPNGTLQQDPFSSYYRAIITVKYDPDQRRVDASVGSDLNYHIELTGNNKANGKLALTANDSAQNFGMRSAWFDNHKNNQEVSIAVPFGYYCSANIGSPYSREVKLYDADGVFGDTYMWVTKNERPNDPNELSKDDYVAPLPGYKDQRTGQHVDSFVRRWIPNRNGNGGRWLLDPSNKKENILYIKDTAVERGANYKLHILNTGTNVDNRGDSYNTASPHSNTLSVKIPQDGIYSAVNCNYSLKPTITLDKDRYVYYPDVKVDASITESGQVTPEIHKWQVYAVRYSGEPSTKNLPNTPVGGNACNVIPAGGRQCSQISSDLSYKTDATFSANPYSSGGPDAVGTRLCFFARIEKPTNSQADSGKWNYSDLVCAVSSKKPRVQFLGSDVRVGGTAISNGFTVNGANYGSMSEYAIFTLGKNTLVASGDGLRKGNPNPAATWSRLTFTNTDTDYGNYNPLPSASSAYAYFKGLPLSGDPLSASKVPNGVYDVGDNLGNTLARLPESRGAGVILRANGDFRITKDIIVNNSNLSKASDITQVVIVADNIIIDDSVKEVDAWLITPPNGSITTCSFGGTLTAIKCDQPLTINGPIYTKDLRLRRTAGNNPPNNLSDPAEKFNLRPDAQLWAYTYANKGDYAQTDYIQELPPRY